MKIRPINQHQWCDYIFTQAYLPSWHNSFSVWNSVLWSSLRIVTQFIPAAIAALGLIMPSVSMIQIITQRTQKWLNAVWIARAQLHSSSIVILEVNHSFIQPIYSVYQVYDSYNIYAKIYIHELYVPNDIVKYQLSWTTLAQAMALLCAWWH